MSKFSILKTLYLLYCFFSVYLSLSFPLFLLSPFSFCFFLHPDFLSSIFLYSFSILFSSLLPFSSIFPFHLSSSLWLSLQCLSNLATFSYHCLILLGGHSASINYLLILSSISLLNFSINYLFLCLPSLAALLNIWINSSIVC